MDYAELKERIADIAGLEDGDLRVAVEKILNKGGVALADHVLSITSRRVKELLVEYHAKEKRK